MGLCVLIQTSHPSTEAGGFRVLGQMGSHRVSLFYRQSVSEKTEIEGKGERVGERQKQGERVTEREERVRGKGEKKGQAL